MREVSQGGVTWFAETTATTAASPLVDIALATQLLPVPGMRKRRFVEFGG